MKSIRIHASLLAAALMLVGWPFMTIPKLEAQNSQGNDNSQGNGSGAANNFNPPPCDFNDQFYADNGIDVTQLVLRFGDNNGTTRVNGPPATGNQVNYVADSTCAQSDPTRRNFRILATTGGNADDGNSPFSCANQPQPLPPQCAGNTPLEPESFEFISILAFLTGQSAFENTYLRNVGLINGGLEGVQQNPGENISIGQSSLGEAQAQTLRSFTMQDIVSNFEAYAALKQTLPNGVFATNPCAPDMQSSLAPATPCFPVNTVQSVFTPNLRQDWRFATNRNAMDGSDNNDPLGKLTGAVSNAPFGYFCDDLLGAWILTYFWFTQPPNTTDAVCGPIFQAIGQKNGFNLDGTPIILTAFELNQEIEANNCGAEGQEAVDGSDGGAVWLICPAIPDPRAGAITSDAFLDQVHLPDGSPLNQALTINFNSLQRFGMFANELPNNGDGNSQ